METKSKNTNAQFFLQTFEFKTWTKLHIFSMNNVFHYFVINQKYYLKGHELSFAFIYFIHIMTF
jgi:hypothetical protein